MSIDTVTKLPSLDTARQNGTFVVSIGSETWDNATDFGLSVGAGAGAHLVEFHYSGASEGSVCSYSHSTYVLIFPETSSSSQIADERSQYALTYKYLRGSGALLYAPMLGLSYSSYTHRKEINVRDSSTFFFFVGESWHYADIVTNSWNELQALAGLDLTIKFCSWLGLRTSAMIAVPFQTRSYQLSLGLIAGALPALGF